MISPGQPSTSINDLLDIVSEAEIASRYLSVRTIPCTISNPMRSDKRPSLGIYSPNGNEVNFIDYATGERGTILTLMRKMWRMSLSEVCERIIKDFKGVKSTLPEIHKTDKKAVIINKSRSILRCKVRDWRDYDIEFWMSFGISLEWLKYAEVYPVSHTIIEKEGIQRPFVADKYAYAYVEHKEGNTTLKIYQPYNKRFKWLNKHDSSVISLWTKVPEEGERICICSSLKDALCLWANTGIPSLAIQGEGYGMSESAINELRRRFKDIYILLDNDKAGLIDGEKLSKTTGFTNLILPDTYGAKDISDLYKVLEDKTEFKQIILNLFANGS